MIASSSHTPVHLPHRASLTSTAAAAATLFGAHQHRCMQSASTTRLAVTCQLAGHAELQPSQAATAAATAPHQHRYSPAPLHTAREGSTACTAAQARCPRHHSLAHPPTPQTLARATPHGQSCHSRGHMLLVRWLGLAAGLDAGPLLEPAGRGGSLAWLAAAENKSQDVSCSQQSGCRG